MGGSFAILAGGVAGAALIILGWTWKYSGSSQCLSLCCPHCKAGPHGETIRLVLGDASPYGRQWPISSGSFEQLNQPQVGAVTEGLDGHRLRMSE